MTTGTVKWFNPNKGFGFILPDDGTVDNFVHISAVERAGLTTLLEGQKIEYELVEDRHGQVSADNLKLVLRRVTKHVNTRASVLRSVNRILPPFLGNTIGAGNSSGNISARNWPIWAIWLPIRPHWLAESFDLALC